MFPSDLLVMSFILIHIVPSPGRILYIKLSLQSMSTWVGRRQSQPLIKSHFLYLWEIPISRRIKYITETRFLAHIFLVVKLRAHPNPSASWQANAKSKEQLCAGTVTQSSLGVCSQFPGWGCPATEDLHTPIDWLLVFTSVLFTPCDARKHRENNCTGASFSALKNTNYKDGCCLWKSGKLSKLAVGGEKRV